LSDYYSNDIAVKAARWRTRESNKGLFSGNIYSKRESWTTALRLAKQGPKSSPPEKNIISNKELLTLTPGNVAEGK
jgi:hypothetical protein